MNHYLFSTLTEQSAYILGFWLADGHISALRRKNGTTYKRFHLYSKDEQILNDIAAILGARVQPVKRGGFHIQEQSDQLFDFCYEITKSTSKSDKSWEWPSIPNHLWPHLIRGYFDGDGSLYWVQYKNRHKKVTYNLRSSFTAGKDTGDLLERLQRLVMQFIPISKKKISSGKKKKWTLSQYDTTLLCYWMYTNATISLTRKHQIWDEADKTKLLASPKYRRKAA